MIRMRDAAVSPARAIVFDKDGVIVDFAPRWLAVTQARLAAMALRMPLNPEAIECLRSLLGVCAGVIDPTGPLVTGSRAEEITLASGFLYQHGMNFLAARACVEEAFDEAERQPELNAYIKPTGELGPTLTALRALGLKLAIATTDLTERARADVSSLGLAAHFDVVLGVDAVARNKPHPDLFLEACRQMGVEPGEAWMVGDALNDIRMARAAKAGGAIGVRSGISSRELLESEADLVLDGIWDLPARLESSCPPEKPKWHTLFTDGAARGNPGPAALGAVLLDDADQVLLELSERLGIASNNVAEYRALLAGLHAALARGIRLLVVKSDSELMIKQLQGEYAMKSAILRPLYREALELLKRFKEVRLFHVRREANQHADRLANRAFE